MRPISTVPATLAAALLAALTAGCGDHVTDPAAFAESAEAEAVLRSAATLPSLPSLIDAAHVDDGDRAILLRASELWTAALASHDDRTHVRLHAAARLAAPVLARTLTPDARASAAQGLEAWIRTLETSLEHLALPAVEARVWAARRRLERARAAERDGAGSSREIAVLHLVHAAADLAETTPRFVARRLATDAAAALDAAAAGQAVADGGGGPERSDLERAARLKDWALRAVDEGDYLLAIQRAFYALQLVEDR